MLVSVAQRCYLNSSVFAGDDQVPSGRDDSLPQHIESQPSSHCSVGHRHECCVCLWELHHQATVSLTALTFVVNLRSSTSGAARCYRSERRVGPEGVLASVTGSTVLAWCVLLAGIHNIYMAAAGGNWHSMRFIKGLKLKRLFSCLNDYLSTMKHLCWVV